MEVFLSMLFYGFADFPGDGVDDGVIVAEGVEEGVLVWVLVDEGGSEVEILEVAVGFGGFVGLQTLSGISTVIAFGSVYKLKLLFILQKFINFGSGISSSTAVGYVIGLLGSILPGFGCAGFNNNNLLVVASYLTTIMV